MHDAFFVRRFERVGNLPCDGQRFVEGQRPGVEPRRERLSVRELEDEEVAAVGFVESVNRRDVRMVQRREYLRLAFESRNALDVGRERGRQRF